MTVLVTGSAGHLGEALVRELRDKKQPVRGIDIKPSSYTDNVGSIVDRDFVKQSMSDVHAVLHAATLHKPHVATHPRQDFVDTNITGTLNLLEEAVAAGVKAFVFTSTTSAFGAALTPAPGQPAAWINEQVAPIPKNIYGVTKVAAEGLCELFARRNGLATIILRTSRFFPEDDDNPEIRGKYARENAQANELLYRRVDVADVVSAHLVAAAKASQIGFARYIISATTPFSRPQLSELSANAPAVVEELFPGFKKVYARRNWSFFPRIDRVYDNSLARAQLDWQPRYDFAHALEAVRTDRDFRSPMAQAIGIKGYHHEDFGDEPYPVD